MEMNSFDIEFEGVITINTFFGKAEAEKFFHEWVKEQGISAEITDIIPLLPNDVKPGDYYTEKINNLLNKIKLDDDGVETLEKICKLLENGVD